MNNIISKELLEEVYAGSGVDSDKTLATFSTKSVFTYCDIYGNEEEENIHELAHKVKEFILKEYPLMSIDYWSSSVSIGMGTVTIEDKTEIEAIFKAGQWKLENKDV